MLKKMEEAEDKTRDFVHMGFHALQSVTGSQQWFDQSERNFRSIDKNKA